ncbi:TIGR04104 family putative zinc finger protein [Jeotgalibacillus haloalkalitolerans]|uniref:TIGR04104 family putative zinc finger protein n=1 Tax=Jeotgalibacillus haloalkalitolerans TaxID=3104292 RepID=A0ABU5KIW7_9BACL|nr:TIGR04104 family putative zinc finger protein [Jeotgalibacillus sp. HH7-29]MDZ5711199.1 TIGR04104 family putative zinc finger protein [Jeotgalibacillus sp. HH7-29]
MAVCQNCHQKWPYSKAFKRIMWFNSPMKCPHCGEKQYVTKNTRKRSATLSGLVSFIIIFSGLFLELSFTSLAILAVAVFVIAILVMPLGVKLSNEDEPLW